MQFTIWLTTECNMKCTYCYEGNEKSYSMMKLSTATEILDFIEKKLREENEKATIIFHGGEPLLNYNIIKYMTIRIKSWDVESDIMMTTNCSLLDDEKIEFIVSNFTEISVSLDGKKSTHDQCRVFKDNQGSYDLIIKNIQKLVSKARYSELRIRGRMTVTTKTYKDLYRNIDFLYSLGIKLIVPVLDTSDNSKWNSSHLNEIVSIMRECYEKLYINDDLIISLIEEIRFKRPSVCMAGEITMHISPSGKIYPCAYVMNNRKFLLGDVIEGILNEKVEKLKNINKLDTVCKQNCAWYEMCIGTRCKLVNYSQTGDFFKPSFCTCFNERLKLAVNKSCKSIQPEFVGAEVK